VSVCLRRRRISVGKGIKVVHGANKMARAWDVCLSECREYLCVIRV